MPQLFEECSITFHRRQVGPTDADKPLSGVLDLEGVLNMDNDRYEGLDAIIDQVYGSEESSPEEVVEETTSDGQVAEVDGQPEEAPEEEVTEQATEEVDEISTEDGEPDGESADDETSDEQEEESGDDKSFLSQLVTVKVNGEEYQVSVEQAVKGYQMAAAANAKFEEAATIRKQSAESVEFRETFDSLWNEDQGKLISHFVGIADDPGKVVEAVILQAAAIGKLPANIADALGLTDEVQQQLSVNYEKERLQAEREALAAERERANQSPDTIPDQHGLTVVDYRNAIQEIVRVAGLADNPAAEQRAYLEEVFKHGDEQGIGNPYLAFASYREAMARKEVERSARAKQAVAKVSPAAKSSAALSPKGQVQHSPTRPVINSTQDAADWALQELERRLGAL